MNNPTREEVEKARDQWRYGLASVLVHDAIQLANSYLALLDENEQLKLRLKTFDDERKRLRIVEEEIERLKEENKWLDPEYAEEQLSKAFHEASKEKKKSAKKFCMVPEDTYKRQAAVVEAVIAYKDDLTVENWERVIEALAKSDGGGGETSP